MKQEVQKKEVQRNLSLCENSGLMTKADSTSDFYL